METNRRNKVVVVVTHDSCLGDILATYIVDASRGPVMSVEQIATPITIGHMQVTDGEREVVELLDNISQQHVAKYFSRGKTVKAFFSSLTEDAFVTNVRPHVEKYIRMALEVIAHSDVELYLRSRHQSLNINDRLDIAPLFDCRPRFFFTLTPDNTLLYMLKVSDGVNDVSLAGQEIHELSQSPAVFVANNVLYSFSNIDIKKFRPFFKKVRIVVEPQMVEKYMQGFVLNCVKNYRVSAFGFSVTRQHLPMSVRLSARRSFVQGWGFDVAFVYGTDEVPLGSSANPVNYSHTPEEGHRFVCIARSFADEDKFLSLITSEFGMRCDSDMLFLADARSDAPINLVRWHAQYRQELADMNVQVVVRGEDAQSSSYYMGDFELSTNVNKGNDWFDIHIVVHIGQWHIPFVSFVDYIKNQETEYVLPDGSIFVIPVEWLEEWGDLVPFAKTLPDGSLRVGRMMSLPSALRYDDDVATDASAADMSIDKYERKGQVNANLRAYQEDGVRWMASLAWHGKGGILADDMGLGKTLQVIALLADAYATDDQPNEVFSFNRTGILPSVVVVPSSLIFNWRAELSRFAPQLSIYTYVGKNAIDGQALPSLLAQYHVVLTTYAHARLHYRSLSQVPFLFMVLDESHIAKNPSSQTYSALSSFRAKHRLNLSGTPVENRLGDLWAQLNLVNPGMLGSRVAFEQHFATAIERHGDSEALRRLRAMVRPFILRRTKEDVLKDLPPLTIQTIPCEMTEHQHEVYEREKSACRNMLLSTEHQDRSRRFMSLQALTRLRLIANHPALCKTDYEYDSGKTEVVMEHITNVALMGHKMLVFSSFVRDLDMLSERLTAAGIGWSKLTGQTVNRESVINDFIASDSKSVFLISLKAGGVGLNLTCADYVFILNPWWNPAAEAQAYNRAHRHGQTQSVMVYRFISVGTIEEKIDKMQSFKKQLADNVVADDNVIPTEQELEELLS